MNDEPLTTNDPASEPTEAEVETRAIELAKTDGLAWAAPGTPEQGIEGRSGTASNDDRERYRSFARKRIEAERGLIIL